MSSSRQLEFDEFESQKSVQLVRQWNNFQRNLSSMNEQEVDQLRMMLERFDNIVMNTKLTRQQHVHASAFFSTIYALFRDKEPL